MDQRIADLVKFQIKESQEHQISAELLISPDLPSFEGHFPGDPVLPAVSILDVSLRLLSEVAGEVSYTNIQVKRSKFMGMVRPNQWVEISAESSDGQGWQVAWRDKENQTKLAQLHVIL